MNTSSTLQIISERLFRENICPNPLNEKDLLTIAEFMRLRNANSELMRRLSNVEINYIQIRTEAEESCRDVSIIKEAIVNAFKNLINLWSEKGYLQEFIFSFQQTNADEMRSDLSACIEYININLNIISKSLIILGETSAQMRACSASFLEIYHEAKLATYAAMLNKDKEELLDCRAISLQSHASATESTRAAAHFLGMAKNCTRIISIINALIAEASISLYSESTASYRSSTFSPTILSKKISDTIRNLEYINSESN